VQKLWQRRRSPVNAPWCQTYRIVLENERIGGAYCGRQQRPSHESRLTCDFSCWRQINWQAEALLQSIMRAERKNTANFSSAVSRSYLFHERAVVPVTEWYVQRKYQLSSAVRPSSLLPLSFFIRLFGWIKDVSQKCCSWLFVFLLIYIIYVFCIFSHVERSRDVYLLFYLNGDMHCHHHLLIKSLSFGWNGTNIIVILVIINRRRSLLLDWFEDVMNAERLHLNTQCFHHGVI